MDWIQNEPDVHEASAWFFNKMMHWESKDFIVSNIETEILQKEPDYTPEYLLGIEEVK